MNSIVDFFASDLGKFVAASSVLAALITSGINIFNIRSTNKRVLQIENNRQNTELNNFRFTKLYNTSLELEKIPAIIYDLDNVQKLSDDLNERYNRVKVLFNRVEPLMVEKLSVNTVEVLGEVELLTRKAVEAKYNNGEIVSWKDLAEKQQKFWEAFRVSLSNNIKALTKNST